MNLETEKRIELTQFITIIGLLSGIFLSLPLWIGPRNVPFIPFFSNLAFDQPIHSTIFFCGIIALVLSPINQLKKWLLSIFLVCLLVLISFDITRLQPWVLQYAGMIAVLAWNSICVSQDKNHTVHALRIIIASGYIFGGLHKMNIEFFSEIFPWFISPFTNTFPSSITVLFPLLGILIPIIEIWIGIGLFINRSRNFSILLSVLMMVFVLLMLGPFGHNWNSVIWPWNIAMPALVLVLFYQEKTIKISEFIDAKKSVPIIGASILFVILPSFSLIHFWNPYLSSSLYASYLFETQITIQDVDTNTLPTSLMNISEHSENKISFLPIYWFMNELNVLPFPTTKTHKGVAQELCRYTNADFIHIERLPNNLAQLNGLDIRCIAK